MLVFSPVWLDVQMQKGKEKLPPKMKTTKKPPITSPKKKGIEKSSVSDKHQQMKTPAANQTVAESDGPKRVSRTLSTSANHEQSDETMTAVKRRPFSSIYVYIVVICWAISAFALLSLVWYVYQLLDQSEIDDAELEEVKSSTRESLIALKKHTVQCNKTIYDILLLFLVLAVSVLIGFMIFYKDAAKHRYGKAYRVAGKADETVHYIQLELDEKMCEVSMLKGRVQEYKDRIEDLQQQLSKKDDELMSANAKLLEYL